MQYHSSPTQITSQHDPTRIPVGLNEMQVEKTRKLMEADRRKAGNIEEKAIRNIGFQINHQ